MSGGFIDVQDGGHQDMGDIGVSPYAFLGGVTINQKTSPVWFIGGALALVVVYLLVRKRWG